MVEPGLEDDPSGSIFRVACLGSLFGQPFWAAFSRACLGREWLPEPHQQLEGKRVHSIGLCAQKCERPGDASLLG